MRAWEPCRAGILTSHTWKRDDHSDFCSCGQEQPGFTKVCCMAVASEMMIFLEGGRDTQPESGNLEKVKLPRFPRLPCQGSSCWRRRSACRRSERICQAEFQSRRGSWLAASMCCAFWAGLFSAAAAFETSCSSESPSHTWCNCYSGLSLVPCLRSGNSCVLCPQGKSHTRCKTEVLKLLSADRGLGSTCPHIDQHHAWRPSPGTGPF